MNSKNCPKWWNFAKSGRTDADLGWRYQVIGGPLDSGPVTLAECIVFSESTHFLFFSKTNFTGKTLGFRWDPNAQPLGHEALMDHCAMANVNFPFFDLRIRLWELFSVSYLRQIFRVKNVAFQIINRVKWRERSSKDGDQYQKQTRTIGGTFGKSNK